MIDDNRIVALLKPPDRPVDVVIDTDTFNEADDQFALAYLLRHQDRLNLEAIYAAPFLNRKVSTPREGVERSMEEIERILDLTGESIQMPKVHRGAPCFLIDEQTPMFSDGIQDLVDRAMAHTPENPLYIIGIAAATDLASAYLLQPEIRERIVVIWLGGSAMHCMEKEEFNLIEDVSAARVLFDSNIPLVQVPAWGVAQYFTITKAEVEHYLRPANPLCAYLADIVEKEVAAWKNPSPYWSKALWDVTAVAWLLNDHGQFMEDRLIRTPVPLRRGYRFPDRRQLMCCVREIYRDALLTDLFRCLMQKEESV